MARSQSSAGMQFVKWAGAAAAAIVGGVAIGYLFGNARVAHPPVAPEQPPVSATLTPAPTISPSSIHPHVSNGNYTAPGAPHIVIEEESQPILHRAAPPVTAPIPDPEASQEATVTPPPVTPASHATPAASAGTTHPDTVPAATPTTSPDTSAASTTPVPTPAAPPPAPADPDFEHVNTGTKPAPNPGASDPESGQQGGAGQHAQGDGGKSQFRVQTGAYTDESNARSIADSLRSQGYATSTRSEHDGDHLVYKVQVGAYRSKVGASKAADDLQKKGYPAFISPITP